MTLSEYRDYEKSVKSFFDYNNISHLSPINQDSALMRFVWVDCTGKQLFNTTFKDFDSAWEFIDSINRDHKIENNLGYFEKNGDFINELWAVPS